MIAFNGKEVSSLSKSDLFVKDYLSKIELLKQAKSFTFRCKRELIKESSAGDVDSQRTIPAGYLLQPKYRYLIDGGEVEAQWYLNSSQSRDGVVYSPVSYDMGAEITLSVAENLDLIYFLVFVCPHCAKIEGYTQNKHRRHVYYELYSREEEVTAIVDLEAKLADVKTALFSKTNGLPIAHLRLLASNFGIRNTDTYSDNEIRYALDSQICHKKRGEYDLKLINNFLDSFDLNANVKLNASVQLAKDRTIIKFAAPSAKNSKGSWKYSDGSLICEVGASEDPTKSLVNFLDRYPDKAKELIEAVEAKAEVA